MPVLRRNFRWHRHVRSGLRVTPGVSRANRGGKCSEKRTNALCAKLKCAFFKPVPKHSASGSPQSLCIKRNILVRTARLLPHVQYDGFPAGDLNRLSRPVGQNGPGERRHIGDRATRGIGLIFTHDPEALLAAVIPAQGDGHPEGGLALVGRRVDDFRARAPRPPVTDFPQSGCGGFPVAFVCRAPARGLETAESGFDGGNPAPVTKLR